MSDTTTELVELCDPEVALERGRQGRLFPCVVRQVLEELDIKAIDAQRLHVHDLLSFDPVDGRTLGPSEEQELRFLGGLLRAGCDVPMMRWLLRDLTFPYAYNLRQMVYRFSDGRWEATVSASAGDAARHALRAAREDADVALLAELATDAVAALRELCEGAQLDENPHEDEG